MARIIILLLVVLLGIWWVWGGVEAGDDAYITFHYARNVADGYGIVYNPGEAPTQGSTTMFYMLLMSGAIRLGIEPTFAAYVLNGLGIITACVSLYLLSRGWMPPPVRGALALLVGIHTYMLRNQVSGLETNFWTGLILLGVLSVDRFRETQARGWFAALVALSLLACMTRPESVLIVGIWWLGVLRSDLRHAVIGGLILGGIGGLYLLALKLYFGDILPNPFYVKVVSSDGGLYYVLGFIVNYLLFPWFIFGLIKMPKTMLTSVFILLLFYILTNPLIGDNFRFLNPATAAAVFVGGYGLYHMATSFRWVPRALRYGAAAVISYVLLVQPGAGLTLQRVQNGLSVDQPHSPLYRTSEALRDSQVNLRVAYGDAGMLPYIAPNVTFLDVVGLNDTAIARLAPKYGPSWVIDYIFQWQPDLIAFYVGKDGEIFNRAHGVIGTTYSDLYRDKRFAAYELAGLVDYDWVYAAWFLRRDTVGYEAARAAIQSVAAPVTLTIVS